MSTGAGRLGCARLPAVRSLAVHRYVSVAASSSLRWGDDGIYMSSTVPAHARDYLNAGCKTAKPCCASVHVLYE